MKHRRLLTCVLAAGSALALATPALAQMPVVDVSAIAQLVHQVQTMEQVLSNARNQLTQVQATLRSMTGSRGMQLLLPGVVRNYLPADWQQVGGSLQALSTAYPGLAADVTSLLGSNSVLSATQLASLSPAGQQQIQTARSMTAMTQVMSRDALANSSGRFADLQSLIGAIGSATDQKSILELQARISAEQGMLQNEQNKLQSLFKSLQAEELALQQQEREQIVAGHGTFASRFQPVP